MSIKLFFHVSLMLALQAISNTAHAQLSNSYPNDIGIETDPNVLFVEKFDDGLQNILSRYTDIQNAGGMALDPDIPEGSIGPFSIKMTSKQGMNVGGHLFKRFTPGFDSTVYIRYYVKYPTISNGYFHHEGVWFGGYNPATPWPNPQAGTCGLGDSRLSIAYENIWQGNPPGMDSYLYWGDMQSWNDGSSCYGNPMITQGRTLWNGPPSGGSPINSLDEWMCVEIMIKLNNPVSAYNGELAIWQNGVLQGHWGPGFPNGHWTKDKWYNNQNDPPFEGFRWRTDEDLNINWLWLEFYHDNPNAPSSYIKFDHLVMAKKYIGPIHNSTNGIDPDYTPDSIQIFPNPSIGMVTITGLPLNSIVILYNNMGQKVFSQKTNAAISTLDTTNIPKGIYIAQIINGKKIYTHKIKVI